MCRTSSVFRVRNVSFNNVSLTNAHKLNQMNAVQMGKMKRDCLSLQWFRRRKKNIKSHGGAETDDHQLAVKVPYGLDSFI